MSGIHSPITRSIGAAVSHSLAGQRNSQSIHAPTFTAEEAAAGFSGVFDLTTSIGNRCFQANYSSWVGYLKGSAAAMVCSSDSTNPFQVSVDGGALTSPVVTAGKISLFTALPDVEHLVEIISSIGYDANSARTPLLGTLFEIVSASPSLRIIGAAKITTDPAFPGQTLFASTEAFIGALVPNIPKQLYEVSGHSANVQAVFKAQCSEVWAYTGDTYLYLSIDDAFPVRYTFPASAYCRWRKIPGLDSTAEHKYIIHGGGGFGGLNGLRAIMTNAGFRPYSLPARKRVVQLGDSITAGVNGAPNGDLDLYKWITGKDALGLGVGLGGETIDGLTASLDGIFAGIAGTIDTIILAIGRNNSAAAEAVFKASYYACLAAIRARTTAKIICRGLTPAAFVTQNSWVANVVANIPDENLIYLDPDTWTDIEMSDGVHPNAAGYLTMANHEVAALASVDLAPVIPDFFLADYFNATIDEQLENHISDIPGSGWVSTGVTIPAVSDRCQLFSTATKYPRSLVVPPSANYSVTVYGNPNATDTNKAIGACARLVAGDSGYAASMTSGPTTAPLVLKLVRMDAGAALLLASIPLLTNHVLGRQYGIRLTVMGSLLTATELNDGVSVSYDTTPDVTKYTAAGAPGMRMINSGSYIDRIEAF